MSPILIVVAVVAGWVDVFAGMYAVLLWWSRRVDG